MPYRLHVHETVLDDLRDRIARTRWPAELPGVDWTRGVPLGYLRDLAEYWRTGYDWRAEEARINALPQYTTDIDGARVHFVHVRSPRPDALPLVITHGWPGSIVEFLDVVGPLADDFHLVLPSIPGFPLSGPLGVSGWDVPRVARAWLSLMDRLGYHRFGAQGGDWGHAIARELGMLAPDRVVGVHLNTLDTGTVDPGLLAEMGGYAQIQGTRPQTLAYGLTDSPVGQLAWIAEKFVEWADRPVPRDRLLTNATLYWVTGTAGSSANIYYETFHPSAPPGRRRLTVPTGVAVFGGDLAKPVREIAARDNAIVHWSELPRGGHFAALEDPDLFADDVRTFFTMIATSDQGPPRRSRRKARGSEIKLRA